MYCSGTVRITVILLFRGENGIAVVLLNSPLFLPFGIALSFYYPRANQKITIFSLSSFAILNSSILVLFFA
jgi:hypothetical protein